MQADSQPESKAASPAANQPRDAGAEAVAKTPSVRLSSLGEGFDAGVNDATNHVEIRRRALPTYSFANDHAIDVFAAQRKLSEVDREALHSLERVAQAKRQREVADEPPVRELASTRTATGLTTDKQGPDGEHLTIRDGAIGAAYAAQIMHAGGPLAHSAVQAVGIADAVNVAADVAQGREVRALDVASASASVAMTTGLGGPAVQLAAQGVAAVGAVDAGRRALNTIEEKVGDREDFAQWHMDYAARHRPHDAAAPTSAAAAPASSDKPVPDQQMPTVVTNSIEHVSARELQAEGPDTAELRKRLLADRSSTGPGPSPSSPSPLRPDTGAASAASTEAAREKEDRDRETIARMTRPELDEYAAARKVSEERVDQVLRAAQRRIEAEADRPGVRAYPPLEERFNIKRHLLRRDYEFRDQPGKVAFTERWLSMKSTAHSVAVVKAMVDRAEERGWDAVRVKGSAEFERQVWIAATARGIKALGYEPTEGDRLTMAHERERLNAERGRAHAQDGGTTPARADLSGRQPVEAAGEIPRDLARRPGFARRVSTQSDRPESAPREPAIARALRPLLVERGDSAEDIAAIVAIAAKRLQQDRVYVGKVVGHGEAPYQFDEKNAPNYFLRLATPSGEKTVWSVDLKRALDENSIKVGDSIALEHRGVTPVSVAVTDRDEVGRVTGQHDEVVKRNTWHAVPIEQLRAEALDRSAFNRPRAVEPDLSGEVAERPLAAKQTQAVEQERQTEPRSHARDALVFEALEVAFAAKNVPPELRDDLRKHVQKELDLRSVRGEAIEVGVFDPGAPRQVARAVRVPQRQPQAHDRSR